MSRGETAARDLYPWRALALACAAIAVGIASHRGSGREADSAAFHSVNASHTPSADAFFSGITELGSIWASVGAAFLLVLTGRTKPAVRALAAAVTTWTLSQGLKKAFDRPRPYEAHADTARVIIGKPGSTSWPSSHPAVLMAFVTVAGRDLGVRRPGRAALTVLAGAVGASRTYLGVHYPADVAAGVMLGRAVGLAWPVPRENGRGPLE